jgi:hypothetical protein
MSMGIQVYAVDEAEFKRLFGSNDIALLEKLLDPEGWGKSLQLHDEGLQDVVDGERPRLTLLDALRDIFAGRVTRPDAGSEYAMAFGHACGWLGGWVHDRLHPCNPEDLRELDELLAAHGVDLRFIGGLVDDPPVPLPAGPWLGHWSSGAVVAAAPAFRAMRAAGSHSEPWIEELLHEMGRWIALAENHPGTMLVARCA